MAFTTGTATNHVDMLDKLRQWLTGTVGWTELLWTPAATVNDTAYLSVQGPGAGSGRRTFVNIRAFASPADQIYSWALTGAVDFQPAAGWKGQPGEGGECFLNTWQNAIDYWFYANSRRIIVVAKCSTIYASCYAGFFLPWGSPSQYPFPLYVGGDYYQGAPFNRVNAGRRMFCDPGWLDGNYNSSSAFVRDPAGNWVPIANHWVSTVNDYSIYNRGQKYCIWPFVGATDYGNFSWGGLGWSGGTSGQNGINDRLVPTAQNERIVLPAHIVSGVMPALGALDGVYMPMSNGVVSEQIVTADGKTLRAFQNIHRVSTNDYFLIDEA